MKEGEFNLTISKQCFYLLLSFLVSVAVFSWLDIRFNVLLLSLIIFTILNLIVVFWSEFKIRFFLLLILIFLSAGLRFSLIFKPVEKISFLNKQNVEVVGYIASEPDIRLDSVNYYLQTEKIICQQIEYKIRTKIYFKNRLWPRYDYLDRLKIKGFLIQPESKINTDFRFDYYLANQNTFLILQPKKIEKIGLKRKFFNYAFLFKIKKKLAEKINLLWHEPYSSFMAGLLYGYRGGLGSLNTDFSRTGVTHIVAISGYNITIIVLILVNLFLFLLVPRKLSIFLISLGIFLFVIFTGASASVVRAGIMGVLVLLTKFYYRQANIVNILLLTAVIMVFNKPLILLYDAGFQLSFLSTLGLVYLSPILEKYFSFLPNFLELRETVVGSLAAIFTTLPLILMQFGNLSLVALLTNILILWILPFLMLSGFLAVLVSFVFRPLSQVLAWLTWLGLEYVLMIVKRLSSFKWAFLNIKINTFLGLVLYLLLIYLVWKVNKLNQRGYEKN